MEEARKKAEMARRVEVQGKEAEERRRKASRTDAVASFQTLLSEVIKEPVGRYNDWRPRLEKDPQGRGSTGVLERAEMERFLLEHIESLMKRISSGWVAMVADRLQPLMPKAADGTPTSLPPGSQPPAGALRSFEEADEALEDDARWWRVPFELRQRAWQLTVEAILASPAIPRLAFDVFPDMRELMMSPGQMNGMGGLMGPGPGLGPRGPHHAVQERGHPDPTATGAGHMGGGQRGAGHAAQDRSHPDGGNGVGAGAGAAPDRHRATQAVPAASGRTRDEAAAVGRRSESEPAEVAGGRSSGGREGRAGGEGARRAGAVEDSRQRQEDREEDRGSRGKREAADRNEEDRVQQHGAERSSKGREREREREERGRDREREHRGSGQEQDQEDGQARGRHAASEQKRPRK
ncbi:MAG: hypothetical protein WDW36_002785 [Sanguina aurantia]